MRDNTKIMKDTSIISILKNTSPDTDTAPRARVRRLVAECVGSDLSSWERYEFLPSVANRFVITDPIEKALACIERRIFGDCND